MSEKKVCENNINEKQQNVGNSNKEDMRFRCHYSIVIEKIFKWLGLIVVLIFFNMLEEIGDVVEYISENGFVINGETEIVLIVIGIVLGLIAIAVAFGTFQWAKTYISVTDSVIIIEKNTLFKKKRTIGIRNISNMNTTQNLFEMLIGTCKVKLDTNSASTADETDIDIVLKKDKAKHFQRCVMGILKELEKKEGDESQEAGDGVIHDKDKDLDYGIIDKHVQFDVETSDGDIICHGLCSITISKILLGIAGVVLTVWMLLDEMKDSKRNDWVAILPVIIFCVVMVVSVVWGRIKEVLTYFNYRAKRHQGKIYLQYGLLKKVNYTIPVDKINVITIRQTFIARLVNRYTVNVVNIGMGDEEQEKSGFLLPYLSEEKMCEALQVLLPEFQAEDFKEHEKQPKSCIFNKMSNVVPYFVGLLIGSVFFIYSKNTEFFNYYVLGEVALFGWIVLLQILSLKYEGIRLEADYMKLVTGVFTREYKYIQYEKIQYVTFKQGMLMKKLGNVKGELHVLAPLLSREHNIPYFEREKMEIIKKKLME